jgi:hypothetical protein
LGIFLLVFLVTVSYLLYFNGKSRRATALVDVFVRKLLDLSLGFFRARHGGMSFSEKAEKGRTHSILVVDRLG